MTKLLLVSVLLPCALAAQTGQSRVFRAGAATSNITPPLGSPLVGGWNPEPATNVHDELHSRCLALDDGRTRLVMVVSDNVGISRDVYDEAKRVLHDKTGIPVANMLMSASHTHSAASARGKGGIVPGAPLDDYQRFLASRIVDGVLRAIRNMQPARIGWGRGAEGSQVFNRRWRMKPGTPMPNPFGGQDQVVMNPRPGDPNLLEPAGPTDPAIHFISVQSLSGRPIALLANYSLHYVGGVPGQEVSADYFAVFAKRIEELLGAGSQDPPFVGIMSNGSSGNINNINFFGEKEPRKWAPYEKMRLVADLVAAEVFKACRVAKHHDWVPLGAAVTELPLALRVPTQADVEWAESVLNRPAGTEARHIREVTYARRTMEMRNYPPQIPLILQALRIGDVGIGAIPNEVFVEIGLEIRQKSPFPATFTISQANGSYGYLPTVEHHKLGGYETWRGTNILEIEAAPKIVETVIGLLRSLN